MFRVWTPLVPVASEPLATLEQVLYDRQAELGLPFLEGEARHILVERRELRERQLRLSDLQAELGELEPPEEPAAPVRSPRDPHLEDADRPRQVARRRMASGLAARFH